MKIVMYHYVQEYDARFPNFRFLDAANFHKQLDYFESEYGFVTRDEFDNFLKKGRGLPGDKVLLTFDDGLSCHYDYVFKELSNRGLWGVFFVPTEPYLNNQLLEVHATHLLCGKVDGVELIHALEERVDKKMILTEKVERFKDVAYRTQTNSSGISAFKRVLNYYIDYEYRSDIVQKLLDQYDICVSADEYYMTIGEMQTMKSEGQVIGSHGFSHKVMSNITKDSQAMELDLASNFLVRNNLMDNYLYCYPYGGDSSFNSETVKLLEERSVKLAFSVDPKNFNSHLASENRYRIPRYDCNLFPFGKAS